MMSMKRHGHPRASVSASELAQMGVCERLLVFEHRHGKRRTLEQQRSIWRGRRAHQRFYQERHEDFIRTGSYLAAFMAFGCYVVLLAVKWFRTRQCRHES